MRHHLQTALILLITLTFSFQACKKSTTEEIIPEIPQISSIQPKNPAPGDVVTITGTGFGTSAADVKVNIGSTTITVTSVTATEIKFTVPATIATGDLSVLIKDVAAAIKDPQGATITPKPATSATPTFTAMTPASAKSGDVITLTGTNFMIFPFCDQVPNAMCEDASHPLSELKVLSLNSRKDFEHSPPLL
ncbi:MAG: hypothetical protein EOP48_01965 [Sphingobacteriales bacterium]|nr:MAG: hypothetical protein EOP48_01965 [Sphingobacteriales bacterium]